jgi:hypothetical protein
VRIAFLVRRAQYARWTIHRGYASTPRLHPRTSEAIGCSVEKLQMQDFRNRQDVQDKSRQRRIETSLVERRLLRDVTE